MLLAGVLVATVAVVGSGPEFVHTWRGDQAGERYGFAVSELSDIDGDGAREAIVGAPFHNTDAGPAAGHTDVMSGRTGRLLYRFEGEPEDRLGYAMADAGDVNRDGVADIAVGATGVTRLSCVDVPRSGRLYVYSGKDGSRLLRVDGEAAGDQFGAAVAGAGDVDRDGHADVLVGARLASPRAAEQLDLVGEQRGGRRSTDPALRFAHNARRALR